MKTAAVELSRRSMNDRRQSDGSRVLRRGGSRRIGIATCSFQVARNWTSLKPAALLTGVDRIGTQTPTPPGMVSTKQSRAMTATAAIIPAIDTRGSLMIAVRARAWNRAWDVHPSTSMRPSDEPRHAKFPGGIMPSAIDTRTRRHIDGMVAKGGDNGDAWPVPPRRRTADSATTQTGARTLIDEW
jgi:hypothetical protein